MTNGINNPVAFGALVAAAGVHSDKGTAQELCWLLDVNRKGPQHTSLLSDAIINDGKPHGQPLGFGGLGYSFYRLEVLYGNFGPVSVDPALPGTNQWVWEFDNLSDPYVVTLPSDSTSTARVHDIRGDGLGFIVTLGEHTADGFLANVGEELYLLEFQISESSGVLSVSHTFAYAPDRNESFDTVITVSGTSPSTDDVILDTIVGPHSHYFTHILVRNTNTGVNISDNGPVPTAAPTSGDPLTPGVNNPKTSSSDGKAVLFLGPQIYDPKNPGLYDLTLTVPDVDNAHDYTSTSNSYREKLANCHFNANGIETLYNRHEFGTTSRIQHLGMEIRSYTEHQVYLESSETVFAGNIATVTGIYNTYNITVNYIVSLGGVPHPQQTLPDVYSGVHRDALAGTRLGKFAVSVQNDANPRAWYSNSQEYSLANGNRVVYNPRTHQVTSTNSVIDKLFI